MLKARDFIDIAINGSKQFHNQKSASAETTKPDPVLQSHVAVADRLVKAAAVLKQQEPNNGYAPMLQEVAKYVLKGIPAKTAMYTAAGGSQQIAGPMYVLADGIADDLLKESIAASYQQKLAAFKAKKTG